MACFIVTYDLNNETVRPNILKDIHAYGRWAQLSESSYAIVTGDTAEQVYSGLSKHIDDNDNIYIISLSEPHFGQGPHEVNEWLAENLPG